MAGRNLIKKTAILALEFALTMQAMCAPLAFAAKPKEFADLPDKDAVVMPVQQESEEELLAKIKAHPQNKAWDAFTLSDFSDSPYAEKLFKEIAEKRPRDVLKYIFVLDGHDFKDDVFCHAVSRADLDILLADDLMTDMLASKMGLLYSNPETRPLVSKMIQKKPDVVLSNIFYLQNTPEYKSYVEQIIEAKPCFTKDDLFSLHSAYKEEDLFLKVAKKSPAALYLWGRDGGFLGDIPEKWISDFQKAIHGPGTELSCDTLPDEVLLNYADVINELHEENDRTRFAILEGASSQALFSILHVSRKHFYTSSYAGILTRLQKQMEKEGTNLDALIDKEDHDKKLRTMISSFSERGVLEDVLSVASPEVRGRLAKRWVESFGHEVEEMDREFGKLKIEEDNKFVLRYVKAWGADRMTVLSDILGSPSLSQDQRRGLEKDLLTIYKEKAGPYTRHCLELQFASYMQTGAYVAEGSVLAPYAFDKKTSIAVDQNLYEKDLFKDGVCRQQVVFAFDKDSQDTYRHFLGTFKNDAKHKWQIDDRDKFLLLSSEAQGRKIEMVVNKPAAKEAGLEAVQDYLEDKDWSVLVSRGHSYHFDETLKILRANADKVKFLYCGGCGGYLNRQKILLNNPDVPFVSTQRIGTMFVNDPVFLRLSDKLMDKGEVVWNKDWSSLTTGITDPRLQSYLPPDKNKYIMFEKSMAEDLSVFLAPENKPVLPMRVVSQEGAAAPAL